MITKFIKYNENKNIYPSDLARMDIIEDFIKNYNQDKEYNEEDPDLNDLLNPYGDYDQQSYIQNNLKNKELIYWEGWSQQCWTGLYNKPEYKGLSKEEAIEKLVKERFPRIAEEFNMKIKNYSYFWVESDFDTVEDGYVMKVIMEPK